MQAYHNEFVKFYGNLTPSLFVPASFNTIACYFIQWTCQFSRSKFASILILVLQQNKH